MTGREPLEPSEDIGTPAEPGGPGSTEYEPLGEPDNNDIYVPGGGKGDDPGTSPSEH